VVNPIARVFDRVLGMLKWPIAIAALVLATRAALRGCTSSCAAPRPRHDRACPCLIGAAVYSVFWLALGKRRMGFWSTLEHEFTQCAVRVGDVPPGRRVQRDPAQRRHIR